jgi:GNAT superfamily N-acetyltransferase
MDFFLSLAEQEGWNPGLQDGDVFYNVDPHGFFLAKAKGEKHGNETIGCIAAVAYNAGYGFIGFYIVKPEFRGRGFGVQLWKHALHYLGDRIIGLDSVLGQQENYKKSHFTTYYKSMRFESIGGGEMPSSLMDLRQFSFEKLLDYDTSIYGFSRRTFLQRWIEMSNAHSLGMVVQDQLVGFGTIRKCRKGFKIGPLFADDSATATEIYKGLCSKVPGSSVYLDVPEINQHALKIAEDAHMKMVFETARMYNRTPPKRQLEKVFGITSFELG